MIVYFIFYKFSFLIKENNIFEEVEKRCQSFIDSYPLINAYRKKEWNKYFYKYMMNVEREEDIEKGKFEGIKEREFSMTKSMKTKNLDIKLISEITGLTIDEIKKN